MVVAAFAFGVATAWAGVLAHGRAGGLLLALAPPVSFGLLYGLDWIGDDLPLVAVALFSVPFGFAWLLLGYDLLTIEEGGVAGSSTPAVGDRDR